MLCGLFCPEGRPGADVSCSKEVDVFSIEAGKTRDSPPPSPAYEELVEVVTHAVAKLNIS